MGMPSEVVALNIFIRIVVGVSERRGKNVMRIILTGLMMTLATQALATSITLRYWNGSYGAQISGLKSVGECERLAKQKQLAANYFYCIQTGKPFDKGFEKQNNWK